MSKELESIRSKIDSLDDQIHDLIMERANLIASVIEEKKKHGLPIVHPAREAKMIRRLLARHKGPLPEAAVIRIWRELVGAVSMMQDGLKVIIADHHEDNAFWDMSRNYFGSIIPMQKAVNPLSALSAVRDNEASFAVLPWPQNDEETCWWPHLLHQSTQRTIRIVSSVPYGFESNTNIDNSDKALIVSKTEYRDSEDDHSFIAMEWDDPSVSRRHMSEEMKNAGFDLVQLQARTIKDYDQKIFYLAEVKGHVLSEDKRLKKLNTVIAEGKGYCVSLGGYPVVPEFKAVPEQIKSKEIQLEKIGS